MSGKLRYCECGRELEKYQRRCSECAFYYAEIARDMATHTYRQTVGYYNSLAKSNQRRIENGYFKEYEKTEKRMKWRREYEKTRLEYKREWRRKRDEKIRISQN